VPHVKRHFRLLILPPLDIFLGMTIDRWRAETP
jgi:hypothetical protein